MGYVVLRRESRLVLCLTQETVLLMLFLFMRGTLWHILAKEWTSLAAMSLPISKTCSERVESTSIPVLSLSLWEQLRKNTAPSVWPLFRRRDKRRKNTRFPMGSKSSSATTKKKQERSCLLRTESALNHHVPIYPFSCCSTASKQFGEGGHRPPHDSLQRNCSFGWKHAPWGIPWPLH